MYSKILIVCNELDYFWDQVSAFGYELETFKDLNQVRRLSDRDKNNFNLIIMSFEEAKEKDWKLLRDLKNLDEFTSIPILLIAAKDDPDNEVFALKLGADDVVLKTIRVPNLLARIDALKRRSNLGKKSTTLNFETIKINTLNNGHTFEDVDPLSHREREILKLVAKGHNNNEIANYLDIKEITVSSHLKNIFKKLNVSNRIQAGVMAFKLNLVD